MFCLMEVIIPLNNSHSVIDKPEFVNLVRPPTIIIKKTKNKLNKNQLKKKLLFFLSCENHYNLIYIYILLNHL